MKTAKGFWAGSTLVALFILVVLALFLVKLPTWLLDLLLVANLLLAMTLLLRAIFSERDKLLYSFPTILVLATLFRLSLNVSSTKLILLQGDQGLDAAGKVIQSFGSFVVSGDFVVGFILFAIIAIVNFVVIAKGSARVAEVAARFSLDALPGRQLSIDSDLRNENISGAEARVSRLELDRQSQFFGAMDGAMKWVQGDAIAGFVITCINAVGGVGIGVSRGMSFSDAMSTFGLLTIGDGLLSILPSLLISVAAGIVVTNSTGVEGEDSANQILTQLFGEPKALQLAAIAMLFVGALGLFGIADFPFLPFFTLGGLTLLLVYYKPFAASLQIAEGPAGVQPWPLALERAADAGSARLHPLKIEVAANGLGGVLREQHSEIAQDFWSFAQRFAEQHLIEFGVALAQPVFSYVNDLSDGEYRILVRDRVIRSGAIQAGTILVDAHESFVGMYGAEVVAPQAHPITQHQCTWIRPTGARTPAGNADTPGMRALERAFDRLKLARYTPIQFLWLDAVGAMQEALDDLIGIAEVKQLIASSEVSVASLVEELVVREQISYAELAEVFRRLARERVSIRDVKRLIEGVAEFAVVNPPDENQRYEWLGELHEFLRILSVRGILQQCRAKHEVLRAFLLSKEVEEEFQSAVAVWDRVRTPPPLDPLMARDLRASAQRLFSPVIERGALPVVVVCSNDIRAATQEYLSRLFRNSDWFRTLSYEELASTQEVELVSVLHTSV